MPADGSAGNGAGNGERARLRLVRWRRVRRGFVVGFADVELPIGLKIVDVMVIAKGGKVWANLPGRPRTRSGDGGPPRLDLGHDGKPVYEAVLSWRTRELADGFSARVIEVVRAAHPDDLPHGAAAATSDY